ncbi:MAG TPA: fumarate hydratase [Phycisphaerales bacterium]|nr:fumarate hydratase [Phycisphaerales bacterium]
MRNIQYNEIATTVKQLCIDCCYDLPADVLDALKDAATNETNPRAIRILNQVIENAAIAKQDMIPLCQDTGLTVVFIEQGADAVIQSPTGKTITDAINEGVTKAAVEGLLRKSIVSDPLNDRPNTNTNAPAVIHHSVIPGDKLNITVMTKGGGCENKSQFKMFNPTEDKDTIIEWIVDVTKQAGANACPPFVIGVGIGGNFEKCCLISKKALLGKTGRKNPDEYYAQMESQLLEKINALGLGPQGLGGDTTALAVHIETAPCHIASLPVAVNIECHSHRHKSCIL